MRIRFTCRRYFGNNIFAKIMAGAFIPIVFCQQLVEIFRIKHINAHTGKRAGFIARHGGWISRFFNKFNDFVILIHGHDAKRVCLFNRDRHAGHGAARPFFNVIKQHPRIILFIDMVPGQNNDIFRIIAADNIQVLGHSIRRPPIPVLPMHPLLCR